jgi:hypothetical protein
MSAAEALLTTVEPFFAIFPVSAGPGVAGAEVAGAGVAGAELVVAVAAVSVAFFLDLRLALVAPVSVLVFCATAKADTAVNPSTTMVVPAMSLKQFFIMIFLPNLY